MGVRLSYQAPQFTEPAKEAVSKLYPAIKTGLGGYGLTPTLDAKTLASMQDALEKEYLEGRSDLESGINRYIPRADINLRQYMRDVSRQQYNVAREDIGREFEFKGFEDLPVAQNLAFGALGSEKGISTQMANMATESSRRRSDSPTFGTQLMGGLGGALGTYLALGQPQTNTFSPNNVQFGKSLEPGFMGSSYMSNFSAADFGQINPLPSVGYANRFSSFGNMVPSM